MRLRLLCCCFFYYYSKCGCFLLFSLGECFFERLITPAKSRFECDTAAMWRRNPRRGFHSFSGSEWTPQRVFSPQESDSYNSIGCLKLKYFHIKSSVCFSPPLPGVFLFWQSTFWRCYQRLQQKKKERSLKWKWTQDSSSGFNEAQRFVWERICSQRLCSQLGLKL